MNHYIRATLSLIKLTFIGRSGSNSSTFYLYRATSADLSSTPSFIMHMRKCKRGVVCVRYCPYPAIIHQTAMKHYHEF